MLVQFSSPATETITMFGNAAVQLLKLMGATGRVPGGLSADDVPPARALEPHGEAVRAHRQGHHDRGQDRRPDPNSNPALRRAMQNARAVNMPKDKVEAAIKRRLRQGRRRTTR